MKNGPSAPGLEFTGGIILILAEAAEQAARRAIRQIHHHYRPRQGATLRPGAGTPLWNELVKQAQPLLRKRGSKTQLARLLKVPRQRIQDCLKAETACFDAERALLLMCWVATRQQGRELVL